VHECSPWVRSVGRPRTAARRTAKRADTARGASSLPGDGGSVNEQELGSDHLLRVQGEVQGVHDVFRPPGTRRVLAEHYAQVRAALGLVDGDDLDVLDVRPQIALTRVGSTLGLA